MGRRRLAECQHTEDPDKTQGEGEGKAPQAWSQRSRAWLMSHVGAFQVV